MDSAAVKRRVDETDRGEEFAKAFSDFCNIMNNEQAEEAAIFKMMRDHRTIQQSMMGFVMRFIAKMAEQNHDLRNEASVKLAKRIMAIPEEERYLPFV